MKKDFTKPIVILSFFLVLSTLVIFVYYYFVKPVAEKNKKEEISLEEKEELSLLTKAYLNQNHELDISELFFNFKSNEYAVASEYLYLKKGEDIFLKYDDILETAKIIFDNKRVQFENFIINTEKCGKEKYSTLEGFIYKDACDLTDLVYEISEIYKKGDIYIVEFYASLAKETLLHSKNNCSSGVKLTYNLSLSNLENYEYENENYSKCLENYDSGIFYLKDEIIDKMKNNNYKYKLEFKKNDQNFTFYSLKK